MLISSALRYFLVTVDRGSIADAAQTLHVAPSAVSRMIRKLEDDYGVTLLERRPRGVVPSEAGLKLAEYARRLSLEAERARADLADLGPLGQRTIRLAANQAFAMEMLPRIIARLQQRHPDLRVHLDVMQSDLINERIREGKEDIGITYDMTTPRNVEVVYQSWPKLYAVMSPRHVLATKSSIALQDLMPFPMALMGDGSTNRVTMDMCAAEQGLTLSPAFISNNGSALQSYCMECDAVAFFSRMTVSASIERGQLVAIPLAPDHSAKRLFHIAVMKGRRLSPGLHLVIEEIRKHLDDI